MKVVKFIAQVDKTKCTGAKTGQEGCAPDNSPYCQATCPLHIDIRGYIGLIRDGKFDDALRLIREYAPFSGILERVCPRPCESVCKRGEVDEAISINALKRSAGDYGRETNEEFPIVRKKTEKIAIVGAGPAGLAAAYYLARDGLQVTVFEKLEVAGGMMAVGIPEFRLPRDILSVEIQNIRNMGVEIKTGYTFGENVSLESLQREGYRAVFLTTGLHQSLSLKIEGEALPGVLKGIEFLKDVALGKKVKVGKKVIVIGGGNVAMDVALTAKRLGAQDVTIACLEKQDEMPAWKHEIEEALEEGIKIMHRLGPNRFYGKEGKLSGIEFKRCTSVFDERGAFNPEYSENDLTVMDAETAIIAIGQASELSFVKKEGIPGKRNGGLEADPITLQTQIEWVFAGGDALYGPRTVVEAVASGKKGAESIKRYIEGNDLSVGREWEGPYETNLEMETGGFARQKRCSFHTLSMEKREGTFNEINLGLEKREAIDEAGRCLSCECHSCERVCPTGAIEIVEKETKIDEKKCIACCLCFDACPQGAIQIVPRDEPITFGQDPASVDPTRLRELCLKANLHPYQYLCLCSETRVNEVAAAVLNGAKSPEEISLMTGARSGCGIYCMEPMLRLLKAHGVQIAPPKGNRWYNTAPTIWEAPAELAHKYPNYYLEEDKKVYRKI